MFSDPDIPYKRAKLNSRPGSQEILQPVSLPENQLDPQNHTPNRMSSQPGPSGLFGNQWSELTFQKMDTNTNEETHRLTLQKYLSFSDQQSTVNTKKFNIENDQKPIFTFADVICICQRMLADQRQRIREEYENALREKLAEQYYTFIWFDHDQLQQKLVSRNRPSYLS